MADFNILDEANHIVDKRDRETAMKAIEEVLTKHPDGDFLFIHISDADDFYTMNTYASDDLPFQLWAAQSFLHVIMTNAWYPQPEEDEGE